jgi:hypothetical protein
MNVLISRNLHAPPFDGACIVFEAPLLAHDSEKWTGFRKDHARWRNSSAIDST